MGIYMPPWTLRPIKATKREVLVDRETGVQYLFVKSGYGAGLTPLLDRDGKPMVKTVYDE